MAKERHPRKRDGIKYKVFPPSYEKALQPRYLNHFFLFDIGC